MDFGPRVFVGFGQLEGDRVLLARALSQPGAETEASPFLPVLQPETLSPLNQLSSEASEILANMGRLSALVVAPSGVVNAAQAWETMALHRRRLFC